MENKNGEPRLQRPTLTKGTLREALPVGTQLPLLDCVGRGAEQISLSPLVKALYRLICTVNVKTTPIRDAVLALMKEIGAREASIYLYDTGEMSLEHYMRIEKTGRCFRVERDGPDPDPFVRSSFDYTHVLFSVAKRNNMSRLYQFNMVPDDMGFADADIMNFSEHMIAAPLLMAENGKQSGTHNNLGVLVLKGDKA